MAWVGQDSCQANRNWSFKQKDIPDLFPCVFLPAFSCYIAAHSATIIHRLLVQLTSLSFARMDDALIAHYQHKTAKHLYRNRERPVVMTSQTWSLIYLDGSFHWIMQLLYNALSALLYISNYPGSIDSQCEILNFAWIEKHLVIQNLNRDPFNLPCPVCEMWRYFLADIITTNMNVSILFLIRTRKKIQDSWKSLLSWQKSRQSISLIKFLRISKDALARSWVSLKSLPSFSHLIRFYEDLGKISMQSFVYMHMVNLFDP